MASNNSTIIASSGLSTTNLTDEVISNRTLFDQLISLPTAMADNKDLLLLEARLVFTAMACIYIGSHGALRRPPSAKLPERGRKRRGKIQRDSEEPFVQGLMPSDAYMFPILAGTVLVSLYYIIKWLEDPAILNQILRVYFSVMSLASLGKLFADMLHLATTFIFPSVWTSSYGRLYHIGQSMQGQWFTKGTSTEEVPDEKKTTPFPGRCSEMKLSDSKTAKLWQARRLLRGNWSYRIFVNGLINQSSEFKFNDVLGVVLAVVTNLVYYATESAFLSNVMGYAFSYTGIMLISPTTFATGSSVLFGLFFYDIYMVFYTPYMITVATKLDVPIKLVFEGPTRASMLGLGDIVIPGLFIALCLRFDNYMYYRKQQKLVPVELTTEDTSSGEPATKQETKRMVVKPDYANPQGQWGDRFWATKLSKMLSPDATPALKASAFPKIYFHAAMTGYLIGMTVTLVMLLTFKHGQPALLYLVPSVVFATWATAAVRGEVREMWAYTEDGSLDKEDVVVEVDGNGQVIKEIEDDKPEEEKKNKTSSGTDATSTTNEQPEGESPSTSTDQKARPEGNSPSTSTHQKARKEASPSHDDEDEHQSGRPTFQFSIWAPTNKSP
ncbi:signal peptide peptidase-domain-containing protein [Xylariaceae sp. FL0804]|nr:signal peptide peptidase-domain-containing protein [Xylariaceae sp. FL0804]